MAKKDTGIILGLTAAGLALLSMAGSEVPGDVDTGKLFYCVAVWESNIDFGAWKEARRPDLKFGWDIDYGILQSRVEIGLHDIVTKYLSTAANTPNKKTIEMYTDVISKMRTSKADFDRFRNWMNQPNTNIDGPQPLPSLKQALIHAGRTEKAMRQAQAEYFMREYINPALAYASSKGFSYPVSKLICCDSFILNGPKGAKWQIDQFAKGGNELDEMMQYAQFFYKRLQSKGLTSALGRPLSYGRLIRHNPNLNDPVDLSLGTWTRRVPPNVTIPMMVDGTAPKPTTVRNPHPDFKLFASYEPSGQYAGFDEGYGEFSDDPMQYAGFGEGYGEFGDDPMQYAGYDDFGLSDDGVYLGLGPDWEDDWDDGLVDDVHDANRYSGSRPYGAYDGDFDDYPGSGLTDPEDLDRFASDLERQEKQEHARRMQRDPSYRKWVESQYHGPPAPSSRAPVDFRTVPTPTPEQVRTGRMSMVQRAKHRWLMRRSPSYRRRFARRPRPVPPIPTGIPPWMQEPQPRRARRPIPTPPIPTGIPSWMQEPQQPTQPRRNIARKTTPTRNYDWM